MEQSKMRKHFMTLLYPVLFSLAAMLALPAYAADEDAADGATSRMEIIRAKIHADKKLLVSNNMPLSAAEEKAFWPIYDAYQKDLHKINERLVKVINDYALAYNKGAVLNDTAKQLLDEAIAIELAEAKLKQSYAPRLGKVLPAAKVARYLQIENKIRAIIRYDLAAGIPLIE
jgi:hypothetical protein